MSPTIIIIGAHGYCVIVEEDTHRVYLVRSDRRGVWDGPGGDIVYGDGSLERAILAAVLMAWRLDRTAYAYEREEEQRRREQGVAR